MRFIKSTILFTATVFILLSGCKKDSNDENTPPKSGTREELTKDSIFLYARQTYLWNDALPSYQQFNPRLFTSVDAEVEALTQYKINPETGKPYDKYSFIDGGEVSGELGGTGGDYGFSVTYNNGNPTDLRVKYVYDGSPASSESLKRGYQVLKINGRTNLDGRDQDNIDHIVDAIFGSNPSVDLTVKKFDGSTEDVTITRGTYSIDPILFKNVYTVGAKKVGYFVFNSFITIMNDDVPTAFKSELDNLFSYFQNEGINELIIDLRYNGGGSVSTADYLLDYIAPPGQTGVKHIDYFNQTMQSGKAYILKNQKFTSKGKQYSFYDFGYSTKSTTETFSKKGNLNLSRIYFLVSGSTASASELVINSIKPLIDVKLIGQRTYGKPVGFFAIHIDHYDLYIPQFQTKNRNGEGDYFDGFAVDQQDYDDSSVEFGNPSERYLSYALNYADKGSFPAVSVAKTSSINHNKSATMVSKQEAAKINTELDRTRFKGMVETRF